MRALVRVSIPPALDEDVRSMMKAWGRQQAALATETARFFMDLELTMAQFRALAVIRHSGRLTGRELATRLHVTPGTLVPLCDRLEELGYLRRVPDQEDRRLTWLEITPRGDRLFDRLRGGSHLKMMAAFAKLRPGERKVFVRLANRIADHLETPQALPVD
ncbi:MAG TPA: MarR family transcriptional regulator [Candidatus Limnocylindrales bacterium]|nr:MarR family transcriptional regulator [Candidatus Limnocylindrales bacterium]